MASNAPLTIQCGISPNASSVINLNGTNLNPPATGVQYWILVLDRTDLSVQLNITFIPNDTVPAALQPFSGNSKYIMVLTTQTLTSDNLPTGAFYSFLVGEGAGSKLNSLEQVYEAFNCGTWGWMGYTLVSVMDGTNSYEFSDIVPNSQLITLQLMPLQIGNQTLYTPIQL
ncbi:MAG: hypothetical protein ABJA78_06515 [Ferruginibacter sp.]